jgi:hypothetical protein
MSTAASSISDVGAALAAVVGGSSRGPSNLAETQPNLSQIPSILQIAAMTERLLASPVMVSLVEDPDSPGQPWVEFACTVRGNYAEYRGRKSKWYDEVAKIVPGATTEFRLCLTVNS